MIINLYEKKWNFKKNLTISKGEIKSGKNYYLELINNNIIAYGEASPAPEFINGKKLEYWSDINTVKKDLIYLIENINLQNITFNTIKDLHRNYNHLCKESLATFDMLLHDYLAKKQKIPVWKLYTKDENKNSLLTITCINNNNLKDIIDFIQKNKNKYSLLKFKVTKKNKDILPWNKFKDLIINLDFNGMYSSFSEFESDFLSKISSKQKIIFEEPFNFNKLNSEDINKFNQILKNPNFSLVFDDSLNNIDNYNKILNSNINCGFNLKIQKLGGIYPCYQIFKENPTKQFMIGCMTETSLGISSAIQLGNIINCSKDNVLLLDLDSDILLDSLEDNSPSSNKFKRKVKELIGLGYTPNITNLKKIYTKSD